MKKLLTLILFGGGLWAQSSPMIDWTVLPAPGGNGYLKIVTDPFGHVIIFSACAGSISIYSGCWYAFTPPGTRTFIAGTNTTSDACPPDTPTLPGDRHPYGQLTVDTTRNRLWQFAGVCEGTIPLDMYFMTLNADPTLNTLTEVFPAHLPPGIGGDMTYDPVDDCLLNFIGTVWRMCLGASTPDWVNDNVSGPSGCCYGRFIYVSSRQKAYKFGGCVGNTVICFVELYAYDVPTKTWTKLCNAGCTPPLLDTENGSSSMLAAMVYNSHRGTLMVHHFLGTNGVEPAPLDYEYNFDTDQWTQLTTTGGGPNVSNGLTMTFLPPDSLITWEAGSQMWQGKITDSGAVSISGSVSQ